ncbi:MULTISPECIES: alcohol dehydrogenase catalytic domain-containing protein [unclassified Saccharicrinis]|uniref:alcohol dehydrogenase catalytic domain-containing protein n=1 Tax=unclassified Saccharicrinis TaxID=2646859 RepID=UPI003D337F47
MKSMNLTGIRQMEMQEVPIPLLRRDNDVLIRLKVVAVCGSDVHYYVSGKIGDQVVSYPFSVGHECAGIVEKVGASVSHVKIGDRVAIEPAMPCFECDQCKCGRPHTCRKLKFLGCPGQAAGSLSEFIVMPETSCLPIPDRMTYDQAAISEPLAIGLYAVNRAMPIQNAKAGILGFGPIGMSVLLSALTKGASKVFVSDKINERLQIAMDSGAHYAGNIDEKDVVKEILDLEPQGLDLVFECCGKQEAVEQAFDLLKPGGILMLIGIPQFDHWRLPVSKGRHKEVTVMNIRRQNGTVEEALELLANENIDVSNMPTHRFSFVDSKQAFDLVASYKDGVMKAMIDL